MKKIQMVDLVSQYEKIKPAIDSAIMDVLQSAQFINGTEVAGFQKELELYLGVKHVIPCANGTDALQISMMALGLKPGDEVITTPMTAFATVLAIMRAGAQPVLADIDIKVKDVEKNEEHLYTEEQVVQIIGVYQSVLRNIVEDLTDDNLMCVLLEKPMYFISAGENIYTKSGFHLHWPWLFLGKIDQEIHLIPRVKEIISDMKM